MSQNGTALSGTDDITAVRAYQACRDRVDAIDAQLKSAKAELARAETRVLEVFEQHGISSVRQDGRLVYLHTDVRARAAAGHEEDLVAALHETGNDELIRLRVMPQTLSAWVRECDREDIAIPDAVREYLVVETMFSARMRKS